MANSTQNTLTPEKIQTLANLTNVKKISDLNEIKVFNEDSIDVTNEFRNSYVVTATNVNNKYYNYKVKLAEVSNYLSNLGQNELTVFIRAFELFLEQLQNSTATSYINFKHTDSSSDPDAKYSYTLITKLSELNTGIKRGFRYWDYENVGFRESEKIYTYALTDGLVSASLLEEYVRDVVNRILGGEGSDTYISESIDSIFEFIEWFGNYSKENGGIADLLNTMDSKINALDVPTIGGNNKYIKSISETDGKISATTGDISDIRPTLKNGTNISITNNETINCTIGLDSTNNKSFSIGNTKYSLNFNGGKFYISEAVNPYQRITLKLISPDNATLAPIEYGDSTAATKITLSAKPSKKCTIESGTTQEWAIECSTVEAGTEIKAENVSCSITRKFSATLKVKEILTDEESAFGGNTRQTASITVTRNIHYGSWRYFNTTTLDLSNGLTSSMFASFEKLKDTDGNTLLNENGYLSKYIFTDDEMSGGKYVYILIKKSSGTFILGSGTTPGQFPGGVTNTEQRYQPYGSSGPTYYLYMVTSPQSGAFNITIS